MLWARGSVALHERRCPVRKSAIVFLLKIKKPTIVWCGEPVTSDVPRLAWRGPHPPPGAHHCHQLFGLLLTQTSRFAARRHCPSSFPPSCLTVSRSPPQHSTAAHPHPSPPVPGRNKEGSPPGTVVPVPQESAASPARPLPAAEAAHFWP